MVAQDDRQIKVIYKLADVGPETEARLNRAFDALFDETLKEIQAVPEVPTGERLAVQGHWPKLRKAKNLQLQLEGKGGRTALPPSGSH